MEVKYGIIKYKPLKFGLIFFLIGVVLFGVPLYYLEKMQKCESYKVGMFLPNTTITVECNVESDIGQDLILRVEFLSPVGVGTIQIPAHLEIKDPNNNILYDMDFDDKTIISFKPEILGTYTAIITSLEDEENRIHGGSPQILYAFGFLTGYKDINNPVGNTLVILAPIGNILFLLGIVVLIYVGIKSVRKKS